jgi:hypothetical protein
MLASAINRLATRMFFGFRSVAGCSTTHRNPDSPRFPMSDYATKKPVLLDSLNREELIAAGVCVACRRERALPQSIHGKMCNMDLARADRPGRIVHDTQALLRRIEPR